MPPTACPRCQRVNPSEARYCHFDGAELRGHLSAEANRLPAEFVFPSGRSCRTYDELADAILEEWDSARDLLRTGALRQYFKRIGRRSLARAAADAEILDDPDIGLDQVIKKL